MTLKTLVPLIATTAAIAGGIAPNAMASTIGLSTTEPVSRSGTISELSTASTSDPTGFNQPVRAKRRVTFETS